MLLWRGRSNGIPPRGVFEQFPPNEYFFFCRPTIISSGSSPAPLLAGNPIKSAPLQSAVIGCQERARWSVLSLLSFRFIWQETKAYFLVLWFFYSWNNNLFNYLFIKSRRGSRHQKVCAMFRGSNPGSHRFFHIPGNTYISLIILF